MTMLIVVLALLGVIQTIGSTPSRERYIRVDGTSLDDMNSKVIVAFHEGRIRRRNAEDELTYRRNTWRNFNNYVNEMKNKCPVFIVTKDWCDTCDRFVNKFKQGKLVNNTCVYDGTSAFETLGGGYVVPQIYENGQKIGARRADEIANEAIRALQDRI